MLFVDINTFFSEKGGGIKTYHLAKVEWFKRQKAHHYTLIFPASQNYIEQISPNVTYLGVKGLATSKEKDGYRIFTHYGYIKQYLKEKQPHVLEVGDPWLNARIALNWREQRIFNGILTSFCHGEPIRTWVEPWQEKASYPLWYKNRIANFVKNWFLHYQKQYDKVLVASKDLETYLTEQGFNNLAYLPFGIDATLFDLPLKKVENPIKILYMGRLGDEKGIDVLIAIIDKLMANPKIQLTVVGRGLYESFFKEFKHPRFIYLPFIKNREEVFSEYVKHDIVLAPGPYETFGLGVLEALAAGKIVVGADAKGVGEMLQQLPNPFTFQAGNAPDFLQKIEQAVQLIDDTQFEEARKLAQKYGTWDDAFQRMIQFYENEIKVNKINKQ